ncbi:MAG: AAA family ATPase [Verrucomicrobia bacterium]|nr:AAA family ATPase [Verrucomicrobiota bacterium]
MSKQHLIYLTIADPSLPWQHRSDMARELFNHVNPETEPIVRAILDDVGKQSAQAVSEEKARQLDAILKGLQEGPMRGAVFIEMLPSQGGSAPVALVILDDGTEAYAIVPNEDMLAAFRLGDRVVLDGKGRVLLRRAASALHTGEVARLERRIDGRHIEASLRAGAERAVYLAAPVLIDQIKAGQVSPGAALIVSPRRSLALAAIPAEDKLSHYRFLERGPVPDVQVDRDIGAPPRCIDEVARHVRMELEQPELRRRYRLRRCCTKLLCGASGTGKSLAIAAIHRRLYEIMSEAIGRPIDQLPPRVFRIRASQILSMWLGESEKNWQRAMDEALQLADETFTAADGRTIKLPVLIVLEEVDGIGRVRGHEAIHDRILTTVLQSLDPGRLELADRLVVVLATTNEPQLVDPALLRRVGGAIEHFSRLRRRSFVAVLEKLTRGLPAISNNGCTQQELWEGHIQDLAAWFFSPNGSDPGLVELTFAGSTTPVIKYRRDFLTGALVDAAVQQAAAEASQAELESGEPLGITLEQMLRAFDAQLRGIAGQLKEQNVGSFTDLPDGARVAMLRRIPQPAHLSFEYHRNADPAKSARSTGPGVTACGDAGRGPGLQNGSSR